MMASNVCLEWIKQRSNILFLSTLGGIVVGAVLGICLLSLDISKDVLYVLGFPGIIYIRILKLLVLPLVITSLTAGMTELSAKTSGKLALVTLVYFVITTFVSSLIGLGLVTSLRPGVAAVGVSSDFSSLVSKPKARVVDAFLDLLRNLFPDNLVEACFRTVTTVYKVAQNADHNSTDVKVSQEYRNATNTLGLIVFCVVFGGVLSTMRKEGTIMITFFKQADAIVMKMVLLFLYLTPIGVGSILCERILSTADAAHLFSQLGWFVVTVIIGLFIHHFILIQLIYFAVLRKNPFIFWSKMLQACLTAFAIDSSAATLPVTMYCTEIKAGCDTRVTRFVLPLGATINMNGTAIFVTSAAFFIAQMNGVSVSGGSAIMCCIVATTTSIAATAVPSAALFLLSMVLSVIGAADYTADIGLLFAIDWFVDRCRTVNNILGDAYAAAVVQHLTRHQIQETDFVKEETRRFESTQGFSE